jgi:RNA polymerase sigma-70 factor (ECF subfamily)
MTAEEFNALFRAQLAEITRFLARRLPSEAVDDVAADLFALAWAKRSSIPKDLELPWLYKAARYLIANYHRKETGRAKIFSTLQEPIAAPSAESIALADLELSEAWQQLAPKDKEALGLWALEGLEPQAIAVALGLSTNAVNIRLSRAKKNLIALLEKN